VDLWESAIIAVSSLAGAFFVVMGFRGLIESLGDYKGQCADCGRVALLPLPQRTLQCLRCHYAAMRSSHFAARHADLPH
jgi:hypothetical protein